MDRQRKQITDMTEGNPFRLLLLFTVPLAIGNFLQELYSMADTIIVGRFVGVEALAAVGTTAGLLFFAMGMVQGAAAGFTIVTSQRFGAGDGVGVRNSTAHCILLSMVYTVLLTVVSLAVSEPIMRLMNTPAEIYDDALAYIRIIFWGYGATMLYNLTAGILRALGDSRRPLYFLIVATGLNIVLDLLFIPVLHMGVRGAAYATVLAQLVAGAACLVYMARNYPEVMLTKEDFRFSLHFAGAHLKIGLPMAFQYAVIAIGIVVLQRAVNGFGTAAVAGYTAGNKVELLLQQPRIAVGTAMATYCGQNMGAKRFDRIRSGTYAICLIGFATCAIAAVLNVAAGEFLTTLFISDASMPVREVVAHGVMLLRTGVWFYIPLQCIYIFRSGLQGLGDAVNPFVGSTIELIARTVISVLLPPMLGFMGVCLSAPLAWLGAGIYVAIVFCIKLHRFRMQEKEAPIVSY